MARWIDLKDPSKAQLEEQARLYGLHPLLVQDCLDPDHLSKLERSPEHGLFLMLRLADPQMRAAAMTIRGITRKIAIFAKGEVVLTIHRSSFPFLDALKTEFGSAPNPEVGDPLLFSARVARLALETFRKPLESSDAAIERCESRLPHASSEKMVRDLHAERRRLSSFKRVFAHTKGVLIELQDSESDNAETTNRTELAFTDLREMSEGLLLRADELQDDATSLLNLSLAMQGQRTNEVMRVLTLFSVFFMPLTFIVGIYGMNFHFMPEIHWEHGYAFAWGLMAVVTVGIGFWFRRRGWLNGF